MANPLEFHVKVLMGDLVLQVAKLAADNEALREQLAAVTAERDALKKAQP